MNRVLPHLLRAGLMAHRGHLCNGGLSCGGRRWICHAIRNRTGPNAAVGRPELPQGAYGLVQTCRASLKIRVRFSIRIQPCWCAWKRLRRAHSTRAKDPQAAKELLTRLRARATEAPSGRSRSAGAV